MNSQEYISKLLRRPADPACGGARGASMPRVAGGSNGGGHDPLPNRFSTVRCSMK